MNYVNKGLGVNFQSLIILLHMLWHAIVCNDGNDLSDMYIYRPIPESECSYYGVHYQPYYAWVNRYLQPSVFLNGTNMGLVWLPQVTWCKTTYILHTLKLALVLFKHHLQDCDVGVFQNTRTCNIQAGLAWHRKNPNGHPDTHNKCY